MLLIGLLGCTPDTPAPGVPHWDEATRAELTDPAIAPLSAFTVTSSCIQMGAAYVESTATISSQGHVVRSDGVTGEVEPGLLVDLGRMLNSPAFLAAVASGAPQQLAGEGEWCTLSVADGAGMRSIGWGAGFTLTEPIAAVRGPVSREIDDLAALAGGTPVADAVIERVCTMEGTGISTTSVRIDLAGGTIERSENGAVTAKEPLERNRGLRIAHLLGTPEWAAVQKEAMPKDAPHPGQETCTITAQSATAGSSTVSWMVGAKFSPVGQRVVERVQADIGR